MVESEPKSRIISRKVASRWGKASFKSITAAKMNSLKGLGQDEVLHLERKFSHGRGVLAGGPTDVDVV